jgi:UPF0755 protein
MRRAIIILGVLGIAGLIGWVAYSLHSPYQGFQAPGVFVDIPKGSSGRTIARLLAEQGAVRDQWTFQMLERYRGRALQAGEYYFDHPETEFQIYDTLAAGRVFAISVTIPEGFNTMQIADLLESKNLVPREEFLAAAKDPSPIKDIAPGAPSVEGFLYPATYAFPRHLTARQAIAAMTDHFRAEWNALTATDPLPANRAALQIVTLASLVESETPKPEERPIIAGVFENRLRLGMTLDCDPTVIYALEKEGRYHGTLTLPDMRVDSPYNTYRHPGLPPGPIANPGDTSLRAALHPSAVNYIYFVADTEGGHMFARTLSEHYRNIARYHRLLKQKNPKESVPPGKAQQHP